MRNDVAMLSAPPKMEVEVGNGEGLTVGKRRDLSYEGTTCVGGTAEVAMDVFKATVSMAML